MLEGYFDESGIDGAKPEEFPCVAGFLFSTENASKFDHAWEENVRPLLPTGAEAFHAVDCFQGNEAAGYKNIPVEQRVALFDTMIKLTNETASVGVVVGVEATEYESEIQRQPRLRKFIGSPYSVCALRCIQLIGDWLDSQNETCNVRYVFEHGARHESELHGFVSHITEEEVLRKRMRFGGLCFSEKGVNHPIEAADLLAWTWHRCYCEGMFKGVWKPAQWESVIKKFTVRIYPEHLTATGLGILAIVHSFYGLNSIRDQ